MNVNLTVPLCQCWRRMAPRPFSGAPKSMSIMSGQHLPCAFRLFICSLLSISLIVCKSRQSGPCSKSDRFVKTMQRAFEHERFTRKLRRSNRLDEKRYKPISCTGENRYTTLAISVCVCWPLSDAIDGASRTGLDTRIIS